MSVRHLAAAASTLLTLGCLAERPQPTFVALAPDELPLAPERGRLRVELIGGLWGEPQQPDAKELWVHVTRVSAHSNKLGWVDLFEGSAEVDLLNLSSSALLLGTGDLPAGQVTQVRLYTAPEGAHRVVLASGEVVPLKIPDGGEDGIQVKGPFEVASCAVTTLPLAIDGQRSLASAERNEPDPWVLHPVVRVGAIGRAPHRCASSLTASR